MRCAKLNDRTDEQSYDSLEHAVVHFYRNTVKQSHGQVPKMNHS